jgi:putative ABC transport system ATP-binding protein
LNAVRRAQRHRTLTSRLELSLMIFLRDVRLCLQSAAGPVDILKGIDLDVERGTALSVVGPSGSGKSSLMALIGGIERPTGGTIEIAGRSLNGLSENELALFRRRHIGILFQAFHLIPTMTAIENVALPRELGGRPDAMNAARDLLAEMGLGHRLHHYPTQLSGGEQQRVALARALANEPDLLLADEPTGNLDGETGQEIAKLIFDSQRRRSMTLVMITHDHRLAELCGRSVTMASGRLTGNGRMAAAEDACLGLSL